VPVVKNTVTLKTFASMQVRRRVANLPVKLPLAAHGEEQIIRQWLGKLGDIPRVCVDIAASDGVDQSNSFFLYKEGWTGMALEADPSRFRALAAVHARRPEVGLARAFVTPENVSGMLDAYGIQKDFGFLSFDIDGFDFFVLEALLQSHRPALICAEINEKIPPPVRFTVRADVGYGYRGDHFYGMSVAQLKTLTERVEYDLVELNYNNAFLVPRERGLGINLGAEEAYRAGYADQPDRKTRFAYNEDMEPLLTMNADDAVAFLERKFADRRDEFVLEAS
jgi:hypothetical protein